MFQLGTGYLPNDNIVKNVGGDEIFAIVRLLKFLKSLS